MSAADPNRLIMTGENPFLRLSQSDGGANSTDASFWRVIYSGGGPGHVLYLKSELTENRWRIYSDNISLARWLQSTVQGMLNAELADTGLPVTEARFSPPAGDPRTFWTERATALGEEIALTWYRIGEPMLLHTQPHEVPGRRYGLSAVLVPALGGRLTRNGVEASGQVWPREREGRPFSTCSLSFAESWTEDVAGTRKG